MRLRRFALFSAACVVVAVPALAKPKRGKIECAKVSMTKLESGWGKIPAALQKLPPDASLCGVSGTDTAFVLSALDAQALEKFYTPLFAAVGCKPLTCKPNPFKTMVCACPKGGDPRAGSITLQTYDQAYQLFYSAS